MPRIDIELTSSRPDGTWTWRVVGARQPKGVVASSVLHEGAKVGDVLRAEADFDLDGINVTSVTAPKAKKVAPEVLPILGSGKVEELVTHSPGIKPEREGGERKGRGDRFGGGGFGGPGGPGGPGGRSGGRGERGPVGPDGRPLGPGATRPRASAPPPAAGPRDGARREGGAGRGPGQRERARPDRPERPRGERVAGDRPRSDQPAGERPVREGPPREGAGRERREGGRPPRDGAARERPARPPAGAGPARPRPQAKRLQAGRAHREAALAALAPEQRAIAEQVLRGGLAGVRQAVEEQNVQARAAGSPEIRPEALLSLAEELLPGLRAAEWRDRAEAAAAIIDEVGLRDLRSVVAGADLAGRDEESRTLASRLREGLERRTAAERQAWVDEIATCLTEGRVVRALRVSSRAPEQGLRLPGEVSANLTTAVADAMAPETAPDRWLALLEAVLASPVRRSISPKGLPAGADEATIKTVRAAISKVPALAALLGEAPSTRPVPPPPPRRPPAPPAATPPAVEAQATQAPPETTEPDAVVPPEPEAVAAEAEPAAPTDATAEPEPEPEVATEVAAPAEEPPLLLPAEPPPAAGVEPPLLVPADPPPPMGAAAPQDNEPSTSEASPTPPD